MTDHRSKDRLGHKNARSAIVKGTKDATPIVMGYIPIAIVFGILASQVGIGLSGAAAMSVFVFAGSAQLIAVGMIGEGASIGTIVFTTFLVNLRHLLMSSALSPFLRDLSKKELAWFGFQMTDETFAIHSTKFRVAVPPALESFALNSTAQLSWVGGTIVGVLAGGMVKDVEGLGLDYALIGNVHCPGIYADKEQDLFHGRSPGRDCGCFFAPGRFRDLEYFRSYNIGGNFGGDY